MGPGISTFVPPGKISLCGPGEGYALIQLLRKTQSQFTRLDQQQIFSDKFSVLKFLFGELEQFYSSSSSSSEKLFFRVQVRVRQNNRVFSSSSSSSKPCNKP